MRCLHGFTGDGGYEVADQTTIKCEMSTAILTIGKGAQGRQPGLDAVPAFTTVNVYESYYVADGAQSCDEDCLRPTYTAMKSAGLMRPLISGDYVTVLSNFVDPNERKYDICRIIAKGDRLFVLRAALADEPDFPGS